jgi:hypothetical protein
MAHVSQEMKAKIAPVIKAICKKYKVQASLSVRHHSTLVLTVKSGPIDFLGNFNQVAGQRPRPDHLPFRPAQDNISINTYWFQEHFDGDALAFLTEATAALRGPDYFDHSDMQSDFFHCSHYYDVSIGRWDRAYVLNK